MTEGLPYIKAVLPGMLRRRTRNRVLPYDPWNMNAEVGDIMVDAMGQAFYLRKSRGRDKAAAGELTPVQFKRRGYIAGIHVEANEPHSFYWIPQPRPEAE